jgi:hypothetical protein
VKDSFLPFNLRKFKATQLGLGEQSKPKYFGRSITWLPSSAEVMMKSNRQGPKDQSAGYTHQQCSSPPGDGHPLLSILIERVRCHPTITLKYAS